MTNKKNVWIRDLSLILVLLLIGLGLLLFMRSRGEEGGYASLKVNGVEISRHSLFLEGTFPLNGGTNILEVKGNRVRLIDADCPDKLCVRQGWIQYTGQCITCLPNKLTVTIVGGDDSVELVL
ncbi:MAG: NusG domain II-containing protein [Spirochaetales bacterium]|nr:NusG domain II-containing protein [Candidatus Physcosoma equi]